MTSTKDELLRVLGIGEERGRLGQLLIGGEERRHVVLCELQQRP